MAGIIARITRSNRERLDRKKNEISTAKSNATLIPFDDHFVPEVHNKYVKAKKNCVDNEDADDFHDFVTKRLNVLKDQDMKERSKFSWGLFCCEFTLMFVSLASVPTIMIWLLLCWPQMEDNKIEEKPEPFMPWMEVTNEF